MAGGHDARARGNTGGGRARLTSRKPRLPGCSGLSFAELVRQLATPDLAAITVMHAKPDVSAEAIGVIREFFDGPVGVYAESGDWAALNWVFNGLSPDEYLVEADSWVRHGAQIIGGCCGVGPEHIRVLADRLASQ